MPEDARTSTTHSCELDGASGSSQPLAFWLVIADAPSSSAVGRRLPASGLTVGRKHDALFHADGQLSRSHASFADAGGTLSVVDLDSRHGTWVQGRRVSNKRLSPGDYVRVGSFGFVVARAPVMRSLRSDDALVGDSHVFQGVLGELEGLASSVFPALVWGPPGSGRTTFCERVHVRSGRPGALEWFDVRRATAEMLGAELFDAIERARGGTLVLEAVDALPPDRAAILTAALASAERGACRVLATAAREDAWADIAPAGTWSVRMPPLAERRDDIPTLLGHLARRFGEEGAWTPPQVEQLVTRAYRSNVSELAALIERAQRSSGDLRDSILGVTADRSAPDAPLRVARTGAWFVADGRRVDLSDSRVLTGVLRALVTAHLEGRPCVTTDSIAEASWPGERILPRAAKNRVHVAMSSLRRRGLKGQLVRRDEGYALDGSFVLSD